MQKKVFVLATAMVLALCFLSSGLLAQATQPTKIQALNNYTGFINESIHGMVIVHRLLENYNQELNKYVDLDGYQINNFGNSDLPKNIFDDPDNWFYEISPYEWYVIANEGSKVLPMAEAQQLNGMMTDLRQKITRINQIRFDIDNFINANDLNQKENVEKVFSFLEQGTELFDGFFAKQTEMEVLLLKFARRYGTPDAVMNDIIAAFDKNWSAAKNILRSVRSKKSEVLPSQVQTLNRAVASLKAIDISAHPRTSLNSRKNIRSWNQAIKKLETITSNTKLLIETAEVPKEYKYYGKFYYYHNAVLTNQINRYGSGFAHEMNVILKDLDVPVLWRIEEPHFYQVIYPRKLVAEDIIASSDDNIVAIPSKLKDRKIKKSTHTIKVDTSVFEINLYDYKIQDGDIVSINFNGDWILENHSLEGKSTKLKVQMNMEGKNYLLLHAVNEGRNPPNTMGISYMYKGELQKITLSSNLAESETIEIIYDGL